MRVVDYEFIPDVMTDLLTVSGASNLPLQLGT